VVFRISGSSECLLYCTTLGPSRDHLQHIEPHGLGQWSALANDHVVSFLHTEAGGNVGRDVRVPLLIPLVFLDEVKVVPTNNDSPVHFSTMACSRNDATSN